MKYLNIFDKLSKNVKNIDFLSNISNVVIVAKLNV